MKKLLHSCAALGIAAPLMFGAINVSAESDEWEFSVAPLFVWGKSIDGTASAGGKNLGLDVEFVDDILDNLEAAFAVHFEAKKGNLALYAEYNYAHLDPTVEASIGPLPVVADVKFKDTMTEGGVAWTFADSGSRSWELLGGLRYYKQDIKVKFSSSLPVELPLPNKISVGDSWVHPFAGLRFTAAINDRWSFRARGDYGYESSDNSALHGIALFDYRFRNWGSAFVGYRYLEIDYENSDRGLDQYGFDGDQQGPLIGINLYF